MLVLGEMDSIMSYFIFVVLSFGVLLIEYVCVRLIVMVSFSDFVFIDK